MCTSLLYLVTLLPVGVTEYCNERICLSVSLFVCLSVHAHISRTTDSSSHDFLCMLPMAMAWSSGSIAIRYILPVLWVMSHFDVPYGCLTLPSSQSVVHTQPLT